MTDTATNQYARLMHERKGASRWTVYLVIIVRGMCGSVHTKTFSEYLKLLGVVKSKWDEILKQPVFKLIEEQHKVYEGASSLRRREETQAGGQQVAAERLSISDEMFTLKMGLFTATKVIEW